MLLTLNLSVPLHNSFRVQQIAGMFDVPLAEKLTHQISINLPHNFLASLPDSAFRLPTSALPTPLPWQIGLILGPSGSGKTTLARRLFGPNFIEQIAWPMGRALIDCFDIPDSEISNVKSEIPDPAASAFCLEFTRPGGPSAVPQLPTAHCPPPTAALTRLLTSVGLSSPPAWIKPYHVLSTGEQFRAKIARALAAQWTVDSDQWTDSGNATRSRSDPQQLTTGHRPLTTRLLAAIDEFTSTLNRPLARIASATLAKSIRSGHLSIRFIAVTCHEDIAPWLAPDWIIDMATHTFRWINMRTPAIKLQIARCNHSAWPTFAPHHYLSDNLNKSARCFLARWRNEEVAFCATLPAIGRKNHRRISRLVTLPDYQGVGIGTRLLEEVAQIHAREGHRVTITASHPALIAHCTNSKSWRLTRIAELGSRPNKHASVNYAASPLRPTATFEYLPRRSVSPKPTPGPKGRQECSPDRQVGVTHRAIRAKARGADANSTAPATPPTARATPAPSQTQPTKRSYPRR